MTTTKSSFSIPRPEITPAGFQQFRKFLEDACGILLGDNKEYLVSSRLSGLMVENQCASLEDLVTKMQRAGSNALKETVVDAMTTNETTWFRDIHPYTILEKQLLPEIAETLGSQSLKIWSAACSSGQEPYSMSMVVEDFKRSKPGMLKGNEKIVATDISPSMLAQARAGEYNMLAIGRGLAKDKLERHFSSMKDGGFKVKPEIQRRVDFRSLNLTGSFAALGKFDIVFCRNVLIYFSSEMKQQILKNIHGTLKPGGYLMLGASESLGPLGEFYEMVHCNPGIIYRAK